MTTNASTHAQDIATLLEAASTNEPDPANATYDMSTKLHIGQTAPATPVSNPMDEGDADEEGTDLHPLEFFGLLGDRGYVVVQPTPQIGAFIVKGAAELSGAQRPLPMAKNFFSRIPFPDKGKQEEGEQPRPGPHEHCTHVEVPVTRYGVSADVAAYRVVRELTPMQKVVPGVGYTLDVTGPGEWGFLPTRKERFVVVTALEPITVFTVPIPIKRAEEDEPGEEYDVIAHRAIFEYEMARARVPSERGSLEFRLSPDTVTAIDEYNAEQATIIVRHQLEPGQMIVTTRNQPLRFACPDGKERAAVHISVPCIDQKPAGDDKGKYRPVDTAHLAATGVIRKMRFDVHYPLEPGSCNPDANPFSEEQAGKCGVDNVMRLAPLLAPDGVRMCLSRAQLTDEAPYWALCFPAARLAGENLDAERPKAKSLQQIQAYAETMYLSARLDDLLVKCELVRYMADGATALTAAQLDKHRRAQKSAESKALGWNKANNATLEKYTTELQENLLPKFRREAAALAQLQQSLAQLSDRFMEAKTKIYALSEEAAKSKKLQDQVQVCERKLEECSKPTAVKLGKFEKSLGALENYYEGALSGGTPGSNSGGSKRKKASSSSSPGEVPDAATYVPPPEIVTDLDALKVVRRKMKEFRVETKKRVEDMLAAGEDAAICQGLLSLVDGQDGDKVPIFKLFIPLDTLIKQAEVGEVSEVSYDIAPYKFLVQRVNSWPENPLKAKTAHAKKKAITKAQEECDQKVMGSLCLNEKFITETEARRLGVTTTCLKCQSWTLYRAIEPKYLGAEWAVEHDVLHDVRTDDHTGITHFWFNPEKVENTAELNPSDETLKGIQSFVEEWEEYDAELGKCTTDEARKDCEADVMEKMEERRSDRIEIFKRVLTKLHERVFLSMEAVHETPATTKKKASQTWTVFMERLIKLRALLANFNTSVVPAEAMENEFDAEEAEAEDWEPEYDDDDDEEERSTGVGEACPECGGLFINNRCQDGCGYKVDISEPHKLRRVALPVDEDDEEAPRLAQLHPLSARVRLTDYPPEELLQAAIAQIPDGPMRENWRSMHDAMLRRNMEHMQATYRLFVNHVSTIDPVSGKASWNHNEGTMLGDSEFASKEAAEEYMRTQLNWDPETTGWLYAKPVLKRPAPTAAEEEKPKSAPKRAKVAKEAVVEEEEKTDRAPKRAKVVSDDEEDEEEEEDEEDDEDDEDEEELSMSSSQ